MSKLAEASKIQVRAAREAVLKAVRGAQKTPLDKNSSEVKKVCGIDIEKDCTDSATSCKSSLTST